MTQRKRNLDGYMADGVFHPIRGSEGYNYEKLGESSKKATTKRERTKEREKAERTKQRAQRQRDMKKKATTRKAPPARKAPARKRNFKVTAAGKLGVGKNPTRKNPTMLQFLQSLSDDRLVGMFHLGKFRRSHGLPPDYKEDTVASRRSVHKRVAAEMKRRGLKAQGTGGYYRPKASRKPIKNISIRVGGRYTKKDVGAPVVFEGYDNKKYHAIIDDVKRGIAIVSYSIPGRAGRVKAYVSIPDQWRLKQNPRKRTVKGKAKRKNISIKVGGRSKFKASKNGVTIGGRVTLRANPRQKPTGWTRLPTWCTRCGVKLPVGGGKLVRVQRGNRDDEMCARCATHVEGRGVKKARNYTKQRLYGRAKHTLKGWLLAGKYYPVGQGERALSGGRKLDLKTGIVFKLSESNGVRIVHNRLLGGWYVVSGPHQTPLNGRFNSKAEAQAWLGRKNPGVKSTRTPRKVRGAKNPNGLFEKFHGRKATKTTALNAPDGTPRSLDKLGKLVSLYAEKGTIKPRVTVWLCADSKGKLHLASSAARLIEGGAQNFGTVKTIEYETTKAHLDKKPTIYFHRFGEEGGTRPTLIADGKGGLKFRGGSYKIRSEGIRD